MELKIEYLPIADLKPYDKNTRKHEKLDVDNIAKSIDKYGMCDAIGIWGKDNSSLRDTAECSPANNSESPKCLVFVLTI